MRRGRIPAHDGVAGGAACGDLVRIGVAVEGDRVADAGFEAAGCGAAQAAASAAVELVFGAPVLDAARVGTTAIADALGGLSPGKLHAAELAADALARALGAAVVSDGSAAADPRRTLVAMSGGVDSAVAALLSAENEAAAITVELWRDPDNDAERSCCSASAVRVARAMAHQMGMAHFTLDLRDQFRAGVVDPWLADHAAGLTPNPCVRCNGGVRLDAMLAFARRIGAPTLTTGHYARRTDDGLLRLAADPAKDQAYMLAGLSRADARAPALPARRPAQSAGPGDRRRARPAGCLQARFAGSLLPGRHRPRRVPGPPRRSGRAARRHRRRRGPRRRAPRGAHHFTVGQRRGPARRRRGRAALRPAHRRRREHRDRRATRRAGDAHRARARGAPARPR